MPHTIVHVIEDVALASGGPSRSSTQLLDAINKTGQYSCRLLVSNQDRPKVAVPTSVKITDASEHGSISRQVVHQALTEINDETPIRLVHIHGIWLPFLHHAASYCQKNGIPYVIAPRGMLEPWSLNQKWLKKKLALWLYQRSDLRRSSGIHVTAESEKTSLESLGFKQNFVVPNGVAVPELPPKSPVTSKPSVLFLSRVHPKKGIEILLSAWRELTPVGWDLKIVGPGDAQYIAQLRKLIQSMELESSVTILPETDDQAKWQLYVQSSLFVLPTHSENFGIVVAEALGAGVPVITTTGTPWAELDELGCGWCIELSELNLISALREATLMDKTELAKMGEAGRNYVSSTFGWDVIADKMCRHYQRLIG